MGMTGRSRREQAVQIADELFDIVSAERFAFAQRASIDHAVARARSLKPYFSGQTADVDQLIDYLQQMTRPRADVLSLVESAVDAAYGLKIRAADLA